MHSITHLPDNWSLQWIVRLQEVGLCVSSISIISHSFLPSFKPKDNAILMVAFRIVFLNNPWWFEIKFLSAHLCEINIRAYIHHYCLNEWLCQDGIMTFQRLSGAAHLCGQTVDGNFLSLDRISSLTTKTLGISPNQFPSEKASRHTYIYYTSRGKSARQDLTLM